ncbi:response regulator transcription factor [Polaribacter aestuariivivens]|uniref:Response regulator transcription factor n=1 Tax=Polaribacter aestuariivivens TaxID=2304626 RepID=A0A5S3N5F0_9FLAO|nr:LytTR family transcriptional regulator DNA-binding domain-containing protein [Polaribacter aestuariivivens]TMM30535.1 response regulator transcription factor [Polaribacter aestuariivivens]
MSPLKVYILEDEIITQEVLVNTLTSLECNVCGVNTNAEDALSEIQELEPDLVFLDIKVAGEKTGVWLANQINIPFIYLSAFNDKSNVKDAAQTNPISYLQKPFREKDVFIALQLAKNKINLKKEIVSIENNYKVKIKVDDILYAKKEDHYFEVYLNNNQKKLVRATVDEFLDMVTPDFIQIHRSFVVHKKYVTGFSNKTIKIKETKLPVSNSFISRVADFLE